MTSPHDSRKKIATARLLLLFCIFFLMACGLGYPILNRFDPRQTPGLSDVRIYAALVTGTASHNANVEVEVQDEDMRFRRFRVLVPWLAKPFYKLARNRVVTWDPVMFGLLASDSLFVAGTAVLIIVLGSRFLSIHQLESSTVGLVGGLLYLVNFAVPNLRLVGLVDAGEGFFLLALLWSLSELELWALPAIMVLGSLTKESFIPLSIVFTAAWWSSSWLRQNVDNERNHLVPTAIWILSSWALGLAAMIVLQRSITGTYISPLQFGLALQRGDGHHFAVSLHDRNLWYIFLWLLPTAIPNLKRFPKSWLVPVTATCIMAFVLDAYFGGPPAAGSAWGRELFSIAGPMLSLSSALFLVRICSSSNQIYKTGFNAP